MAAAVPVVATRVGGVAEVVDDGREGRLVPPADGVALAAAILALLGDPAGRRALGESGRTKVSSQFTLEGMASAYERSYEASLRERRRAATR
jgi:glycosyltransferase involved in cell wall biosynthesis